MKTKSLGNVTFDAFPSNDRDSIIMTFGVYPVGSTMTIHPEDADTIIKAIRTAQDACVQVMYEQ